jgi:hypothetical protein
MLESWYMIWLMLSRMTFQVILFSDCAVDSTEWRERS